MIYNDEPMRVFLTGGSGFIGSALKQELIDRGTVVENYDTRADGFASV